MAPSASTNSRIFVRAILSFKKPLSLYFSGIDKEITMSKREPKAKQLNSIVQEDIRNEIDPNEVSESDSEYSPKKKKQKKINTKKKVNKQQKNGVRPGPKPSGRPSKEKYTCPVKDCNARYRGDSIGNHFQKNANLLALDDVLYAASEYQSTLQEKSSAEGFSDLKT